MKTGSFCRLGGILSRLNRNQNLGSLGEEVVVLVGSVVEDAMAAVVIIGRLGRTETAVDLHWLSALE